METFENFSEIKHTPLQVFNRTIMMNNINNDFGVDKLKEYIEQFTDSERKQMFVMQQFIKKQGYKAARMFATKGIVFGDDAVVTD